MSMQRRRFIQQGSRLVLLGSLAAMTGYLALTDKIGSRRGCSGKLACERCSQRVGCGRVWDDKLKKHGKRKG